MDTGDISNVDVPFYFADELLETTRAFQGVAIDIRGGRVFITPSFPCNNSAAHFIVEPAISG